MVAENSSPGTGYMTEVYILIAFSMALMFHAFWSFFMEVIHFRYRVDEHGESEYTIVGDLQALGRWLGMQLLMFCLVVFCLVCWLLENEENLIRDGYLNRIQFEQEVVWAVDEVQPDYDDGWVIVKLGVARF